MRHEGISGFRTALARRLFAIALGACSLGLAGSVAAKDAAIEAFYGRWQGTGISESELSVYFKLTARDLDVVVKPAGNGFQVAWTTVQREKGDPRNPDVERKSTELTFVPSGQPGIWRASDSSDPLQAPYSWARIRENSLIVNRLSIGREGFELQVYTRTLTGSGMELQFTSFRDGAAARQARGKLVKVAKE
jgi:hypothetical protein